MSHFLDNLKAVSDRFVQFDDTPESEPASPVAVTHPTASIQQAYVPDPVQSQSLSALVGAASSASSPEADSIYQKLVEKTDFEKTTVYQTLQTYLTPLANLGMTPAMQFKAALNQAKAQSGITEDAVLSVFDTLKDALASANNSLQARADDFEQKEIVARQSRLSDIADQMATLQAEQSKVAAELSDAQAKGARTSGSVANAVQRRSADIDGLKATYASLMK